MHRLLTLLAVIGLLTVAMTGTAAAATHTVDQMNLTFDPADLTIEEGDTVEWIWSSGSHTVTNGVDLDDPDVGTLFDEPLTSDNPLVSYTFNEAGDYPYFCRPHLTLGMTGIIRVEEGVANEAQSWGAIKHLFD